MDATSLGAQFSLELAFGVLVALAFVPRAPVGRFFYRLIGATALAPILTASLLLARTGGGPHPPLLGCALALAGIPFAARVPRGASWWIGLSAGLVGCAAALIALLRAAGLPGGAPAETLGAATALATGTVAGSVGLAMVLGHWYLTVPKLEVAHLERLNRVAVASMLISLALLGATLAAYGADLSSGRTPLLGPWGLFHLGTRVAAGILLPLVFAWMTHDSLRFQNTRSATGILYASTVLVLIGTAVSISLQSSYGVPL